MSFILYPRLDEIGTPNPSNSPICDELLELDWTDNESSSSESLREMSRLMASSSSLTSSLSSSFDADSVTSELDPVDETDWDSTSESLDCSDKDQLSSVCENSSLKGCGSSMERASVV